MKDEIQHRQSKDYKIKEINKKISELDKKIENLKKRDTLGKIGFDSVIISDFGKNLKSITTSLLYTDVLPTKVHFITLNQWFDESLLKETSSQPIYFPSINKENYDSFVFLNVIIFLTPWYKNLIILIKYFK